MRYILHQCVIYCKLLGESCPMSPSPSLPEFKSPCIYVHRSGFRRLLYIKSHGKTASANVWICSYTYCVIRAVHLQLVPDLTAQTSSRVLNVLQHGEAFPVSSSQTMERLLKLLSRLLRRH